MSRKALSLELAAILLVIALLVGWGYFYNRNSIAPVVSTVDSRNVAVDVPRTPLSQPASQTSPVVSPTTAKKEAGAVDITGCVQKPATASVPLGGTLAFINRDAKAHVISFGPKISYVVTAQGRKEVRFDFDGVPGTRKYLCDGKPSGGTISITKN